MKSENLVENLQTHCTDNAYLSFLRERAKRCCCKYCGGILEVRKLTYSNCDMAGWNCFWQPLWTDRIWNRKRDFQRAGYFVEETGFDYYPDLNPKGYKKANEYGKNL